VPVICIAPGCPECLRAGGPSAKQIAGKPLNPIGNSYSNMDETIIIAAAVGIAIIAALFYFSPCHNPVCILSDCGDCAPLTLDSVVSHYESNFGVSEEEAMEWNLPYAGAAKSPLVRLLIIIAPLLAIAAVVTFMVFFTSMGRQVIGAGLVGLAILLLLVSFLFRPLSRILFPISAIMFITGMMLFLFA